MAGRGFPCPKAGKAVSGLPRGSGRAAGETLARLRAPGCARTLDDTVRLGRAVPAGDRVLRAAGMGRTFGPGTCDGTSRQPTAERSIGL